MLSIRNSAVINSRVLILIQEFCLKTFLKTNYFLFLATKNYNPLGNDMHRPTQWNLGCTNLVILLVSVFQEHNAWSVEVEMF